VSEAGKPDGGAAANSRAREIAQPSLNFVLDMASDGIPGLKTLDCLLMMAINQANIAPLTRDTAARSRYGALEAPAPDDERRPVSVRAVAASMRLPYETARRHIRRLEAQGVCALTSAGIVVPETFLRSEAYLEAARGGHERLFRLYLALRSRNLLDPLPASHYRESEPPVRSAVRLMSDYLLRTAEALVGRTGELISGLVLLPLLAAAASGMIGDAEDGLSVAVLSRRVRIPAETVRRHATLLVAGGTCRRGPRGLALSDPGLTDDVWSGLLKDNVIAVQRLFAGLAERGVVEAWDRMGGLPAHRTGGAV
jgi:hypothetical protein